MQKENLNREVTFLTFEFFLLTSQGTKKPGFCPGCKTKRKEIVVRLFFQEVIIKKAAGMRLFTSLLEIIHHSLHHLQSYFLLLQA